MGKWEWKWEWKWEGNGDAPNINEWKWGRSQYNVGNEMGTLPI